MPRNRRPASPALLAVTGLLYAVWLPAAFATTLDVKAAGEKTFYVNPRAGNSQITVFSQATLEDFTTICNKVSGEWRLDPRNLESLRGRFALRVADLHTGIELRDTELRGPSWFDAAKYPEITVEIANVSDVKKVDANTATLTIQGTCSLHGQTNPVSIPVTLAYLDESPTTMKLVKGDIVRLRGEFDVKLSDYGIAGPPGSDWIGLRVSDTQAIKLTVFGATERPPDPLQADTEGAAGTPVPAPPPPPPKEP